MNLYRLHDGRLEQIGLSWAKTACCAFQGTGCGGGCTPGAGLGVGCRDVYDSGWNSFQSALAPRSGINAFTGAFQPIPGGGAINAINRRLQVAEADMTEATYPGALYFTEGVYVSTGDAQALNWFNNNSYQRVTMTGFNMALVAGSFNKSIPAIRAWRDHGNGINTPDNSVQILNVDLPGEGRFLVGARVKDNLNGTWRYDYGVYNLSSDKCAGSFTVPVPDDATITNVGFHDVNHHSGEPYDPTNWTATVGAACVTWNSPQTFAQNANSNAIRWGTMYNFWFTADRAPAPGGVTARIGAFKPHAPSSASFSVQGPGVGPCPADVAPVVGDGNINITDLLFLVSNWGSGCTGADVNGDNTVDINDLLLLIAAWGPCA